MVIKAKTKPHNKAGFTLVELAIVIVIIGLLIGGVLQGQELITQSKIRSVVKDIQAYNAAVIVFKDKYAQLPGDFNRATQIWGAISAGSCTANSGTGDQTCNGDGDSKIGNENTGTSYETVRLWQHLSAAKMIKGSYTGSWVTTCNLTTNCWVAGQNAPTSSFGNQSVYTFRYLNATDAWGGKAQARNVITIGAAQQDGGQGGRWHNQLLTPEEMYSLDSKLDDGIPYTGSAVLMSGYSGGCFIGTELTATATYNLSYSGKSCVALFDALF